MSVTNGDRSVAAQIVGSMSDEVLGRLLKRDIAAALAAERERARAPFLALADEYEQEDPRLSRSTMAIFRAVTHDLRRAADDTP